MVVPAAIWSFSFWFNDSCIQEACGGGWRWVTWEARSFSNSTTKNVMISIELYNNSRDSGDKRTSAKIILEPWVLEQRGWELAVVLSVVCMSSSCLCGFSMECQWQWVHCESVLYTGWLLLLCTYFTHESNYSVVPRSERSLLALDYLHLVYKDPDDPVVSRFPWFYVLLFWEFFWSHQIPELISLLKWVSFDTLSMIN